MAPAILFCCLVSAYRGVYEGSRNMTPTAISQIVEAVGKLLFGLSLAAGALQLGKAGSLPGCRYTAGWPKRPSRRWSSACRMWRLAR